MDVINNQIQQVTSGVQAQATQAIDSAKNQAMELASNLTDKIKSAALSGSDILGSAANIGQMIFGSVGSLFQEINKVPNTILGNFSFDKQQLISKNFTEIPKALNVFQNGTSNLSSKGLGFIASTTNKAIEGIDLPGADTFTNFAEMGIGQLGKLTALGGEVLNSGANALSAILGDLQTGMMAGANIVNNVTGGITDTVNDIISPINQDQTSLNNLLQQYSEANVILDNIYSLPDYIKDYTEEIGSIPQANNSENTVNSIYGLNAIPESSEVMGEILSTYKTKYDNITDQHGNYVNGVSSFTGNNNSFSTLVTLANQLCLKLDGDFKNTASFSTNKNLYDLLISLASQSGLGSLAEALVNCVDTEKLFDSRTKQIIGDLASNAARRGDSFTTNFTFQYGNGYIGSKGRVATSLISNSSYNNTNKTNISSVLANMNTTLLGLTTNSSFYNRTTKVNKRSIEVEPPVYDAEVITIMQKTCTDYVDEAITKEDRILVNKVYNLWSKGSRQKAFQ